MAVRAREEDGFGLIELLIAMVVLNVGVLATVLHDVRTTPVVRDPNDDMIIACAIAAKADYLVTRDRDLLELRMHRHVTILTPEALLVLLRSGS